MCMFFFSCCYSLSLRSSFTFNLFLHRYPHNCYKKVPTNGWKKLRKKKKSMFWRSQKKKKKGIQKNIKPKYKRNLHKFKLKSNDGKKKNIRKRWKKISVCQQYTVHFIPSYIQLCVCVFLIHSFVFVNCFSIVIAFIVDRSWAIILQCNTFVWWYSIQLHFCFFEIKYKKNK